ncbi:MAG: hypothetical protein JO263_12520, partial [Candidatus Eremiobacteraeota bacterium]|nr:hypothetical protein [Candidatus Eremiobacteraeota bacterium]
MVGALQLRSVPSVGESRLVRGTLIAIAVVFLSVFLLAPLAVVFAVALALPPKTSNDLWSYTMYGRIVSVYGDSPYTHLPSEFHTDPFYKRISPIWQHRGSVYWPVFVGYATVGTFLAGNSVLVDRLFFQLSAALAAAA